MSDTSLVTEVSPQVAFRWWAWIGRVIDALTTWSGSLTGYVMIIIAFANVYEIFVRKVLANPTIWVLDVSIYSLIWFGFLTAAYGLKAGSHVHVDILFRTLSDRTQKWVELVAHVIMMVYVVIMVYFGWDFFYSSLMAGERSPTLLHAPLWIVKLGVFLGAAILTLQLINGIVRRVYLLARGNLAGSDKLRDKLFLPVFVTLVVIGLVLFNYNPTAALLVLLLTLLFGGVPIFASLGLVGVCGFLFLFGGVQSLTQVPLIGFKTLNDFVLVAVPLFILAGQFLQSGKMGEEIYELCSKWIGHLPGGLAVATIAACAIFAAISGSSVATAATIALVALPSMQAHGYSRELTFGVLAAGGTLGILIPPSIPMILYSSITEESTGQLFIAGVIPGIVLAAIFAGYAMYVSQKTGVTREQRTPWRERLRVLGSSIWGILAPVIVIVGIYTGFFTPTEAAAVAVAYSLVVSMVRGSIKTKDLSAVVAEGTKSSTMILMIMVGAMLLGAIFTMLQVPQQVSAAVAGAGIAPWMVIVGVMLLLVVMGMFLEVVSIMLITIPILYPLVTGLGFNGIWFGVLVTVNMEMALITPPVGLNLYVIQGISKANLSEVLKGVWPFMLLLAIGLLIIALIPQLSLWLPGTMF